MTAETTTTKITKKETLQKQADKLNARLSRAAEEIHTLKQDLENLRKGVDQNFNLVRTEFENLNNFLSKKLS